MKAKFKNYRYYRSPLDDNFHLVLPDYENYRAYDFVDDKFYMASRTGYASTINVMEKDCHLYSREELVDDLDLFRTLNGGDIKGYLLQKRILGLVEKTVIEDKGLTLGQLQRLSKDISKLQTIRTTDCKVFKDKENRRECACREALDDLYEEKNR